MAIGMSRCATAAVLFVVSLGGQMAAAESGFYVAAAGARSKQNLDEQAGVGPVLNVYGPVTGPPSFPAPPRTDPPIATYTPSDLSADETDVGWSLTLGYHVNRYFAAELAYVDAGEASLSGLYSVPATLPVPVVATEVIRDYVVNTHGPALSVLGSLPLSPQWQAFVRGGVFFAKQDLQLHTTVVTGMEIPNVRIHRDFSDQVLTVGAGVQWAFTSRWAARLEYQRTDDLRANEIMGKSRIDQASLSVLFGL